MADIEQIRASNGSGEAARAVVTSARSPLALTLQVDSVTNFPQKFIGTWGKLNQTTQLMEPNSVRVFYGQLNGTNIDILSMAPGYTDDGNGVGDVVVLKPTTAWADEIVDAFSVSHSQDGTLKEAAIVAGLGAGSLPGSRLTNGTVTGAKIAGGTVTLLNLAPPAYYSGTMNATTVTTSVSTAATVTIQAAKVPGSGTYAVRIDGDFEFAAVAGGASGEVSGSVYNSTSSTLLGTTVVSVDPGAAYFNPGHIGLITTVPAGSNTTILFRVSRSGGSNVSLSARSRYVIQVLGKVT